MDFRGVLREMQDDGAVRTLSLLKMVVLSFVASMLTLPLAAQVTEADISARLVGKQVYLRGMWDGDKLSFDADGQPAQAYSPLPFTEAAFKAASVKLKDGKLQVKGERIQLRFNPDGTIDGLPDKAEHGGRMLIEVQGVPGTDFGKALDAIFVSNLASLTPSLPNYWQFYAQKNFMPAGTAVTDSPAAIEAAEKSRASRAMHIGGSVKPPKVLNSVKPSYTAGARAAKFSGNVQVYLWVERDGSVSHLQVTKPVGMGLDDVAVAAVRQYKFAPATRDGNPVTVDLYIDVNFQIY
jgi:TonB family protein